MFKRVIEIKTQPVLILASDAFLKPDTMVKIEEGINARLQGNPSPKAVVLPGCVHMDGWQYGRVETVTETTDEEPGEYMTADVFTPDGKGGADDAETQVASSSAGDI